MKQIITTLATLGLAATAQAQEWIVHHEADPITQEVSAAAMQVTEGGNLAFYCLSELEYWTFSTSFLVRGDHEADYRVGEETGSLVFVPHGQTLVTMPEYMPALPETGELFLRGPSGKVFTFRLEGLSAAMTEAKDLCKK